MKKLIWLLFGITYKRYENSIYFFKGDYKKYGCSNKKLIYTIRLK